MSIRSDLKQLRNSDNKILNTVSNVLYKEYRKIYKSKFIYWCRFKPYMDDEKYIKFVYKKRFGVEPNLTNPQNFNEKNNWRKLHDRRDVYTQMVDKFQFKSYVERTAGPGHTIPLLGVWNSPKEINYEILPDQFVLKANHDGGVIVCRDKSNFDRDKAAKELTVALREDYFSQSREWPYKNVRRKVICEKYMGENLTDYKNYCFNGRLEYTFVWKNVSREDGRKPEPYFCGAYDRNWQRTDITLDYASLDENVSRPTGYEEMVELAEKLSKGIPFVRSDFYIIDGKPYAGEMTFFPWGGFLKISDEWNKKLGEMEKLPNCK